METDDFDEETGNLSGDDGRTPDEWKRFRAEERKRKTAEGDAKDAKREVAFLKAGIDPEDDRMKYFVKGYDGEMDRETIRTAATTAGFLAPPAAAEGDAQAQAQAIANQAAQGLQRVDAAGAGATPPGGGDPIAALDAAYTAGGDAAIEAQMKQAGVPVRYST